MIEALLPLPELVVRGAERVDLVGEASGKRGEAGLDGAAEDERWMRLLNGARQRRLLSKLVRRPAVVERVLGPGPDDDLDLLGEQPKSLPRIEERKPVLDVLTLVPAGAHAHVDASSGGGRR